MVGEFLRPLALVLQKGLLELRPGRQGPDLAVVGFHRPRDGPLVWRQGAQDAHGATVFLVQRAGSPALAAVREGALVAEAQLAVLGAGSAAPGADLAEA